MTNLQYSTFKELMTYAVIADSLKNQLNALTGERVYEHYLKVFNQALNNTDPEQQYILFLKCSALEDMIRRKKDYKLFSPAKKENLGKTALIAISRSQELESFLKKAYDDKDKPPLPGENTALSPIQSTTVIEVKETKKRSMQPKELVRLVEKENKSALIIDFREEQGKAFIKFSKGDSHPIVVISIPREIISGGLLFSNLKLQIPIAYRGQINKISTFDFVVIMDDDDIPLNDNKKPFPSTAAAILNNALTDYNLHDKLKNDTIFMEGGFNNWMLQYPVYVEKKKSEDATNNHDLLDDSIINYKKGTYFLPSYPDLTSHCKSKKEEVEQPAPILDNRLPEQKQSPPLAIRSLKPTQVEDSSSNAIANQFENVRITDLYHPIEQYSKPDQQEENKSTIPRPISPRFAGGRSSSSLEEEDKKRPSISENKNSESSLPTRPTIDRGNKPKDIVYKEPEPVKSIIKPTIRPTIIPSLDRTTKPALISAELQGQLIEIYKLMAENISKTAVMRPHHDRRPGQTGLYNMGNTCFMNACLQALFQTPMLMETFTIERFTSKVNSYNKLGTKGVTSAVFSALLDNVWSGFYTAFRPQRFLSIFQKEINATLMNGEQQDASEFYAMLLASLHEDTNQVFKGTPPIQEYSGGVNIRKDASDFERKQSQFSYSPISKILHPRTVSEVTCSACNTQSITFEENNIIPVELSPESYGRASLTECLHRSFRLTNLDGKWDCPRCKRAQPASQKRSLWSLSPVIVIHLLRFSFNGGDFVKNNIPVTFDSEQLDMSPFLHPSADRTKDSAYKLYSITNHRGRLNSGHYTALSRHLQTGEWIRCDDETVSLGRTSDIDFSNAYILYFKRKNL